MPFTLDQLQAQLDALIAQLSGPAEIESADRRVRNRSVKELTDAIVVIQGQMAVLSGSPSRVALAQHKRGDGPCGPEGDRGWR